MDKKYPFLTSYTANVRELDNIFRVSENFDVVAREIMIDTHPAKLYFIDGFIKDDLMEKIMSYIMKVTDKDIKSAKSARDFANKFIPYVEVDVHGEMRTFSDFVLSGALGMVVEGFDKGILIDARTYPARGVEEPDNDKVLRGSHEGFVETLIFNTAQIRRRIRDNNLTMEIHSVGKLSKTDVVMCFLKNKADKKTLAKLRKNISKIDVNCLTMGQESFTEAMIKGQRYNPFPKVRYTERPDSAAACIAEGNIIILVDNSPAAIIVKTGFIEFLQDTNDYYFPPLVGSYLRIVRGIIFFLAMFLSPVWYLLIKNPDYIPQWLEFIKISEPATVSPFFQLMIIELVIDALKLASLNTPRSLGNSLSIIGALVLGELAVTAGMFSSEVVLFMAFVAIANFAQPSFELGYAFKLSRIFLLILTAIFNIWGFFIALGIIVLIIVTTKTMTGMNYLYPLIPFNWKALSSLIFRKSISKSNN